MEIAAVLNIRKLQDSASKHSKTYRHDCPFRNMVTSYCNAIIGDQIYFFSYSRHNEASMVRVRTGIN